MDRYVDQAAPPPSLRPDSRCRAEPDFLGGLGLMEEEEDLGEAGWFDGMTPCGGPGSGEGKVREGIEEEEE